MKAFVDCDVILDLLLFREPFIAESGKLFENAKEDKIKLVSSPLAIANVHYVLRKHMNEKQTRETLAKLLTLIDINEMNRNTVLKGLNSEIQDFEDAMQNMSASASKLKTLITRNTKDFKSSNLKIISPKETNKLLS